MGPHEAPMDLLALFRLLWRRKVVVLPMCLLATGMVVASVVSAPPTYRASGSVVLLNPPSPPATIPGEQGPAFQNPYARIGDLSVVVEIVKRVMMSEPAARRLKAQGLQGTYAVGGNVDFARGPLMDVSAEASTPAGTIRSANLVMEEVHLTLTRLQEGRGTDPDYFIASSQVVTPSKATRVLSSTIRRVIGAAAVGGILVLATALATEGLSVRRQRRRATASHLAEAALEDRGGVPALVLAEPMSIDLQADVDDDSMTSARSRRRVAP